MTPKHRNDHSEPAIRTHQLTKQFRVYSRPLDRIREMLFRGRYHTDFVALKEINLEVLRGETVGVIGQNGSGKSTLLKILARLMMPSSGLVEVEGRVSSIIELGTGFHPEFTGQSNVFMTASLMGFSRSEIETIYPKIVEFSELGPFMERPVKTYSSGMWVRLAFSTAIAVDPDVLLIDEALTVGDMLFQKKCMNKLKEFQEEGTTIVFVSHDLEAIKTLCDRSLLLDRGSCISEGPPDAVCSEYISLVAQRASEKKIEMREISRERRYGSYEIEVERVDFLDTAGRPVRAVRSGDRVVIRVFVRAQEKVARPSVGILIRDRLGNDIFGTNTCLAGVQMPVSSERWSVSFEMPLELGPRHYYLTVAIHSGEDHLGVCYDWIDNAVAFEVLPGKDRFSGYARLKPRISVRTL